MGNHISYRFKIYISWFYKIPSLLTDVRWIKPIFQIRLYWTQVCNFRFYMKCKAHGFELFGVWNLICTHYYDWRASHDDNSASSVDSTNQPTTPAVIFKPFHGIVEHRAVIVLPACILHSNNWLPIYVSPFKTLALRFTNSVWCDLDNMTSEQALSVNEEELQPDSPMQEFYRDKVVFMTGGTGVLGELFVQKLLRFVWCHVLCASLGSVTFSQLF